MEQTIKITIPDDPHAPATVTFDGPMGDVALLLSEDPESGWKLIEGDPASGGSSYSVDRKLVIPKPRRKGRPDASERMKNYNKTKRSRPAPRHTQTQVQTTTPAPNKEVSEKSWDGFVF